MENQTEKSIEHSMETGMMVGIWEIDIPHMVYGHGHPLGTYSEYEKTTGTPPCPLFVALVSLILTVAHIIPKS